MLSKPQSYSYPNSNNWAPTARTAAQALALFPTDSNCFSVASLLPDLLLLTPSDVAKIDDCHSECGKTAATKVGFLFRIYRMLLYSGLAVNWHLVPHGLPFGAVVIALRGKTCAWSAGVLACGFWRRLRWRVSVKQSRNDAVVFGERARLGRCQPAPPPVGSYWPNLTK